MNYVISITGPEALGVLEDICEELALPLNVTLHGRGTAVQSMLDLLGIESNEKRVVLSTATEEKTAALIEAQKRRLHIGVPGHGIVIAVPLLWIVVSLLASADAAFGALIERIFGVWSVSKTVRTVIRAVFYTLIPALVFYSALAAQTERSDFPAKEKRRASALVAITFTGALAVVYAVFCGIQIAVLFAGDVSALPEGMTYAEYAREGFFQLLLVSGINVVLIITAQRRFVSSKALRALLVFLTACTYLMEASSAMRMMLYVNAYGLTYLRLLVLWFLSLLALILGAAVYTVFHEDFRLFRFTLIASMALWLVFAFARSDAIAARYNLAKHGLDDTTEAEIAHECSSDAIGALRPYFADIAGRSEDSTAYLNLTISVMREYSARGVRGFNFSVWEAMRTAEDFIDAYT